MMATRFWSFDIFRDILQWIVPIFTRDSTETYGITHQNHANDPTQNTACILIT